MTVFHKQEFLSFALKRRIVEFRDVQGSAGGILPFYIHWEKAIGDVAACEELGAFVLAYAEDKKYHPRCFVAVPEGPSRLGFEVQRRWAMDQEDYEKRAYPLPLIRRMKKDIGPREERLVLSLPIGAHIVLLEDTVTTGTSLVRHLDSLLESKMYIDGVIVLTDRGLRRQVDGKTVQNLVEERNVPYHAMSTAYELLPLAMRKSPPGSKRMRKILEHYKKRGVHPLEI